MNRRFAFTLAGHLRARSVASMLAGMSSREFSEWKIIYRKFEPFGELRADLRSGQLISPLINLLLSVLRDKPKFTTPTDWVLDPSGEYAPKPQSSKDMRDLMRGLAQAMGTVNDKRKRK